MRIHELLPESRGTYSPEQAKEIGSCAIIAIAKLTGLSWDDVWEVAKPHFGKFGMNSGNIAGTLRELGWQMDGYYKMPWWQAPGMSVKAARAWLQENDPTAHLWCSINVRGVPHSICFVDGDFHNVLGADRAKLRLVQTVSPV